VLDIDAMGTKVAATSPSSWSNRYAINVGKG